MSLNSSNSAFTPGRITVPLFTAIGASSTISFAMRRLTASHEFNCSPRACKVGRSAARHICFTGSIARSAFLSCTISRGDILAKEILDVSLSISPICSMYERISSRCSGCLKKYSTTSRRLFISCTSFSGNKTQRRSRRAPIGVTVRSMIFSKLLPSSEKLSISSRLRIVKRSNRTYLFSSILLMRVMWEI